MPFYKQMKDTVAEAPNFVLNKNYSLTKETKDKSTYPVDGWYWFDDAEKAKASGNLTFPKREVKKP